MPVYDRRYRGYSGERRSPRGLFWTLARFGLTEVFSKRLLLVLFIIACLPVVVFAALIYFANNLDLLQVLGVRWTPDDELEKTLSGTFFFWLMVVQANLAFLFASFAGPSMVGPDLAHGAMPLYLSRPMRRGDYMLGKLAVLGTLLSALTWVPGLLLVVLQASLAGGDWLVANSRIPIGILLGSLLWIVFLSLRVARDLGVDPLAAARHRRAVRAVRSGRRVRLGHQPDRRYAVGNAPGIRRPDEDDLGRPVRGRQHPGPLHRRR